MADIYQPLLQDEEAAPQPGPQTGDPAASQQQVALDRDELGAASPRGPAAATSSGASTHWLMTTAIMLSDMFGLGTLALPADAARLGWAPALSALAVFAAASAYAGRLYQRLALATPNAVVFDEVGAAAAGRAGRIAVYTCIYATIAVQPIILHITCAEALAQV